MIAALLYLLGLSGVSLAVVGAILRDATLWYPEAFPVRAPVIVASVPNMTTDWRGLI